jgi:hypothetical protein
VHAYQSKRLAVPEFTAETRSCRISKLIFK